MVRSWFCFTSSQALVFLLLSGYWLYSVWLLCMIKQQDLVSSKLWRICIFSTAFIFTILCNIIKLNLKDYCAESQVESVYLQSSKFIYSLIFKTRRTNRSSHLFSCITQAIEFHLVTCILSQITSAISVPSLPIQIKLSA